MAQNIKDFNWDEVKEKLQKAVKLEDNKDDLSIKITILEANIKEDKMVGDMLKGENEIKKSLGQFLGKNKPLDCDVEINKEEKSIFMKFKTKKEYKKVAKLLNDMFFGDFFKKIIEGFQAAFQNFGNNPDN